MPFAYYRKLTPAQRRIYDESDRIQSLELYRPQLLREKVETLRIALDAGTRAPTERAAQTLLDALTEAFGVESLKVVVKERRPSNQTGELHGLYEAEGRRYKISLWMRTARRAQVVKFRTFLRTLIHELCHHLDYKKYRLRDSYHTEGFYKRESSLLRQLLAKPIPEESTTRVTAGAMRR